MTNKIINGIICCSLLLAPAMTVSQAQAAESSSFRIVTKPITISSAVTKQYSPQYTPDNIVISREPVKHDKPSGGNIPAVAPGNIAGVTNAGGPVSTIASITMERNKLTRKDIKITNASNDMYLITWSKILDAVRYELEIFQGEPHDKPHDKLSSESVYFDQWIFSNGIQLPLKDLTKNGDIHNVYWRVRALNLDGKPITAFSRLKRLDPYYSKMPYLAPYPVALKEKQRGGAILYPVYAYIAFPGQNQYEVEVTDEYPENLTGYAPSRHRIWSARTTNLDLYDEAPRIGKTFWRVRAMDNKGNPLGQWSVPMENKLNSKKRWNVGVFGDSISHGGGRMSFSPNDLEYSYEHYLNFQVINLSRSGDTSASMLARFDKDVLPFKVNYLLIMGGTNSLRGGTKAYSVIADLKKIQEKCYKNNIFPILLTLAPVNPINIQRCFKEKTTPDWKHQFDLVNEWIMTQPHIDTARSVRVLSILPTELAVDGLHGDWRLKNMMANEINKGIRSFIRHSL